MHNRVNRSQSAAAAASGGLLDQSRVLVGIDDTDNLTSPGTGWIAQSLQKELASQGLGEPLGVTRHQLFLDPRVPYTSHNSSACLALATPGDPDLDAIERCAAQFLRDHAADGSDPGLAIVATDVAKVDRDACRGCLTSRGKIRRCRAGVARPRQARRSHRPRYLRGRTGAPDAGTRAPERWTAR